MNPPAYDDVLTAANRILDQVAQGFEKWWQRTDQATREKYLTEALAKGTAFTEADAANIRKQTRDIGPICFLLDALSAQVGLDPNDPDTIRQYRNALSHRKQTAKGEFVFLQQATVEAFLLAAQRTTKQLKSTREYTQVSDLAKFVRARLSLSHTPTTEDLAPVAPAPAKAVEPAYPMPKVTRSKKKSLDPNSSSPEADLSTDQKDALGKIERWFRAPGGKHFFALAGAAGTGKTTVTGVLIQRLRLEPSKVMLLAPTGKAVSALKERLPHGWKSRARTLASFLWKWKPVGFRGEDQDWANQGEKPVDPDIELLVVDEASMVTHQDNRALSRYKRVLFTGDPDQLPPVVKDTALAPTLGSAGILDDPDVTLESVHRHGKDSSIYVVSHAARLKKPVDFGPSSDGRVLHLSEEKGHFGAAELRDYLQQADVVLTQRNSVRVVVNEYLRRLRGYMKTPIDFTPKAGEILVCSENYFHQLLPIRVANGERLMVTEYLGTREAREDDSGIIDYGIRAYPEGRKPDEAEWTISSQMLAGDQIRGSVLVTEHVSGPRSGVLRADWGYCLTVHKAQGSEWPRVVVIDDNNPDHDVPLHKWYYVAYSRAVEQLVILKVRRDTDLLLDPGVGWSA